MIGVVTSAQGAVLHDICTTLQRRFPRPVVVWPVPVQGEGAAAQIVAAINGFSALDGAGAVPRPDVVIVARGGGSLEDLMAFNDEGVVRAAAACSIPLISAVGHETDTTLIDFASDRRAPTPTAAAEMAVPVRSELLAEIAHRAARATGALARQLQTARLRLDRAAAALPDLPTLCRPHACSLMIEGAGWMWPCPPLCAGARQIWLGWSGICLRWKPFCQVVEHGLPCWGALLPEGCSTACNGRKSGLAGVGCPPLRLWPCYVSDVLR